MPGQPAVLFANAVLLFQCCQEFKAQEGIAGTGDTVPFRGGNILYSVR